MVALPQSACDFLAWNIIFFIPLKIRQKCTCKKVWPAVLKVDEIAFLDCILMQKVERRVVRNVSQIDILVKPLAIQLNVWLWVLFKASLDVALAAEENRRYEKRKRKETLGDYSMESARVKILWIILKIYNLLSSHRYCQFMVGISSLPYSLSTICTNHLCRTILLSTICFCSSLLWQFISTFRSYSSYLARRGPKERWVLQECSW